MTGDAPLGYESPGKIPAGGPTSANWRDGELHDAFNALTVDDAYSMARNYETIVNLWQQGVDTFARSITRSISDAWEGASAEAAKTAIQNYVTAANQLTGPLETMTNHIVSTAQAVVATKNAMPPGVHIDATSWLMPWHRFDLEDKQGADRQQAWDNYRDLYVNPLGAIDTSIPVLPHPTDATHSLDITPGQNVNPGSTVNPNTGGDNNNTHNQNNQHKSDSQQNNTGDKNQSNDKDSTTPSNTNSDTGTKPSNTTSTTSPDASTHSTGYDPTASTAPSSFSSGGSGGLGSGGSDGTHSGGGLGQSVPSTGTTGAAKNAAAAASRNATSSSGMGGMGGGAGKGKGDEDGQHKTPGYLVNAENLEEWIGDLPKTVPGGVIGYIPEDDDRPRP